MGVEAINKRTLMVVARNWVRLADQLFERRAASGDKERIAGLAGEESGLRSAAADLFDLIEEG